MALPKVSLRQLLEAGVHFGGKPKRGNPRMAKFVNGTRNDLDVIDLSQTQPMLDAALNVISETVANGGRVLFVGTKRQASRPIAEAADRCAQFYVDHRWLSGTLTNWPKIALSIKYLERIDEAAAGDFEGFDKKERLRMERDQKKYEASLGGMRKMGGIPDLLFVIDVEKEALAVFEANKMGIPVVAVVNTDKSPVGVDYIIPGNDRTRGAISLYCALASLAVIEGLGELFEDDGLAEEAPAEDGLAEETPANEPDPEDTDDPGPLIER